MYKIKELPEDFIVEEIPNIEIKGSGEFSYYLLEKKDIDTEKAVLKIADFFRLKRKYFGIAGNKDRHALTKQSFSVKGKINNHDFNDFKINLIGYGDKPISLGDLSGNRFTIVVRNIIKKPEPISQIINYFDEQRFGKHNLEIGLSIIKRDFKNAATLIDYPDTKKHLEKNPNDYTNAIKKVPFKTLNLYIHAVQSFLWNEAAMKYVQMKSKKYAKIGYRYGEFAFPYGKIKNLEIPLLSFDTEFDDEGIKNIYKIILEKNTLTLRDFIVRQLPDITPFGGKRNLIAEVKSLLISKPENDELNPGMKRSTLNFELGKGSYATIAVKSIFSK